MGKAGWPTDRQVRHLTWFGCLLVAVAGMVAAFGDLRAGLVLPGIRVGPDISSECDARLACPFGL
jgi:hypothetical protein